MENIAAGYTQYVYPQALPDPPPYIPPVPSNSPSDTMVAVAKDATQAHGIKYTWPHIRVKADSYAQGIHLLKIPYAPKLITLSLAVYGMLIPFPFDRGKMVASLPLLPLCSLIADPIKALSSKPYASLSTPMEGISGRLFSHVIPYCLWGVTACICSTLYKPLPITVSTCTLTLPGYGLPKNSRSKFLQAQAILF